MLQALCGHASLLELSSAQHRTSLTAILVLTVWECRERTQASDFNAALHDHAQYLQRQKQAEERRAAYEAEAETSPSGAVSQDLSLKPGETIRVRLGGKVSSGTLHQTATQPASA